MKKILTVFIVMYSLTVISCTQQKKDPDLCLWYNQPAQEWEEALPVGNGRLGAMVFGGINEELIQLNEETLWTGGPVDLNPNPQSVTYLADLRKTLFAEDYDEATRLSKKMQGNFTQSYAPLADLKINFSNLPEPSEYYRELDLQNAVATTLFKVGDTSYYREVFVSEPDQVIVVRLSSNKKKAIHFDAQISSQLKSQVLFEDNMLVLNGRAPSHADPVYLSTSNPIQYSDSAGMRFQLLCYAQLDQGQLHLDENGIHVRDANEVYLYLSAATSFNGFDKCPIKEGRNEKQLAQTHLDAAKKRSFLQIKEDHINNYQSYFNRVSFTLQQDSTTSNKSIPDRLDAYLHGANDPSLETLYFQYGRYLLISCSRPGGIAANLQGIWNHSIRPPWSSNFTTNINAEMNYWPAEVCNLSEMHQPFLNQIDNMAQNGQHTAQNFYNMSGWCLHHNSDIWAQTNPVGNGQGDPIWANWMMGGPWVCQHLYEHYRFTGDQQYLRDFAYPLMKTAADFCLDWLVEDAQGHLVTAPSTSPENMFRDKDGKAQQVAIAMTSDMVLVWDLFTNLIEASTILDTDQEWRTMLEKKRAQLYPLKIGAKGNLQEWFQDFDDTQPQHRHISHLIGLHPGRQISPFIDTVFSEACKQTLELRGDDGTGWALAWKINTWARLLDGERAYKLFRNLLRVTGNRSNELNKSGGTYRNLFCAHPPFQIDGNFGGTAGMAEMLIQSHLNEIHLLPALPKAWKTGQINGLCARGAYQIDMNWTDGQIVKANILAKQTQKCIIRTDIPLHVQKTIFKTEKQQQGNQVYYLTSFDAQAGKKYKIEGTR